MSSGTSARLGEILQFLGEDESPALGAVSAVTWTSMPLLYGFAD